MARARAAGAALMLAAFTWAMPARAAVDLTGTWSVVANSVIGPLAGAFTIAQSGTQLSLTYTFGGGAPQGPFAGTVDPDTGAFSVPLPDTFGPVPGLVCTSNHVDGTATGANAMAGTMVAKFFKTTPPTGCFDGGGSFTGTRSACGDGTLDAGESCDDGNTTDGDCCAADCRTAAADGAACLDGGACVPGQCAGGRCVGASGCDPCEACTPAGCAPPLTLGCQPTLAQKSSVAVHDAADPAKDRVAWKWKSSASVARADFGSPGTSSAYRVCVIDRRGGVPTLRLSRSAPAGGLCNGEACWTTSASSARYHDKAADPDGLVAVALRAGAGPGGGRIRVKGKGPALALSPLGWAPPVVVRLMREDASVCWEATYPSARVNDPTTFKATAD